MKLESIFSLKQKKNQYQKFSLMEIISVVTVKRQEQGILIKLLKSNN